MIKGARPVNAYSIMLLRFSVSASCTDWIPDHWLHSARTDDDWRPSSLLDSGKSKRPTTRAGEICIRVGIGLGQSEQTINGVKEQLLW